MRDAGHRHVGALTAALERCDDCLCVEPSFAATVQEVHLVAVHLICAAFDTPLLRTVMQR